jgi:hypothetical protein
MAVSSFLTITLAQPDYTRAEAMHLLDFKRNGS